MRLVSDPSCCSFSSSHSRGDVPLSVRSSLPHASRMFVVTEAEAAAIRDAFQQRGELAAAVELHRLFSGITDNQQAQTFVFE